MSREQKRTLGWLGGISALIFVLLIFPNRTGAADRTMLSVFEVDEYAQYPNLLHMLQPGATFYQSLRNFLIYLHYFYGYPFYFFSALAILPIRWLGGSSWSEHTRLLVTVLRQMINVLPMLLTIGLLVDLKTRLKPTWKAVGLFILLATLPGVVSNQMWWHPDAIAALLMVLTFWLLGRDDLHFGRNFYLAGLACGVSVGMKYFGVYFALAIPIYLLWGGLTQRIGWVKVVVRAGAFIGLMSVGLVISNPLLLLPQERTAVISAQLWQFRQTTQGMLVHSPTAYFQNGLPMDFVLHYGGWMFLLVCIGGLVVGIFRGQQRWLNLMMLAWAVPMAWTINFSATQRTLYFLPIALLMVSGAINWLPDQFTLRLPTGRAEWLRWIGLATVVLVLIGQAGIDVRTDVELVRSGLKREENSASLAFFKKLDTEYLSKLPAGSKLTIYRDWHVYVPEQASWRVEMNWNLANYDDMKALNPDVILVERSNVVLFTDPTQADTVVAGSDLEARRLFYGDVLKGNMVGYRLLFANDFGFALVRTP